MCGASGTPAGPPGAGSPALASPDPATSAGPSMVEAAAFRLAARQGEPYWTDDTVTTVMAPPDRTGGRVAVVEQLLVAGRERPARTDLAGDEVLYVLDGILDVEVGGAGYTVERGSLLFVPRGQQLTVRVLSRTARTLVVIVPADEATLHCLVTG